MSTVFLVLHYSKSMPHSWLVACSHRNSAKTVNIGVNIGPSERATLPVTQRTIDNASGRRDQRHRCCCCCCCREKDLAERWQSFDDYPLRVLRSQSARKVTRDNFLSSCRSSQEINCVLLVLSAIVVLMACSMFMVSCVIAVQVGTFDRWGKTLRFLGERLLIQKRRLVVLFETLNICYKSILLLWFWNCTTIDR